MPEGRRVTSEAALAKLREVNPIPASSGQTNRHRLNRGGHRHANAALYRIIIVRMRLDDRTKDYVARRTAEGKTKSEIIRFLKRHLIRRGLAHNTPSQDHPLDVRAA
jgi:transposase